jgi:phosphoglycolate phosphatase
MKFARRIEAVMIDLDGTLIDTAPEIVAAAQRMLAELALPARNSSEITAFIGQGLQNLVTRCIGTAALAHPELAAAALPVFERHYSEVSGTLSQMYPGVREGLDDFHAQGLRLACVTNKVARFTLPLLEHFGLSADFALIVSGDSLVKKKPDPAQLLHVCESFGIAPQAGLVIGDSPNDAAAARAAGCPVACLPYGYREGREVRELDCDVIVSTLADAAQLVRTSNAGSAATGTAGHNTDTIKS